MSYQDRIVLHGKISCKLNSVSSNSLAWLSPLEEESKWDSDAPRVHSECYLAAIPVLHLCRFMSSTPPILHVKIFLLVNEGEPEEIVACWINFISSNVVSGRLRGSQRFHFVASSFYQALEIWGKSVSRHCQRDPLKVYPWPPNVAVREGRWAWMGVPKKNPTYLGKRFEDDLSLDQTGQDWRVAMTVGGSFQLAVQVARAVQRRIVACARWMSHLWAIISTGQMAIG